MKKFIAIIGFLILFFPSLSTAKPITTIDWIEYWANKYDVPYVDMVSVAICESELNPRAFNRTDGNGGSRGLFQYQITTWNMFSQELGEKLDIWSVPDQARLTAYAFSKGRQYHWSCWGGK